MDVFGESQDDRVTRALDTPAAGGVDAEAKLAAAVTRLKTEFGPTRKAVLVAYNLPVVLHKRSAADPPPAAGEPTPPLWTAAWMEDDFIARSPSSIADGEEGMTRVVGDLL